MSELAQTRAMSPPSSMTPQWQQALRFLQLPATELHAQVQHALETNVMLDTDEAFDSTWTLDGTQQDHANEVESTLHNHLAAQLLMEPLPNGPRAIGRALIGAIDEDGYLTATP